MSRAIGAACLLPLVLAACSSEDAATSAKPDAGTDSGADAQADAPVDADASGPVSVHGSVIFDRYNNQALIPARNATIGLTDGSATTTTADDGSYALSVPPGLEAVLRCDLPGEISVQRKISVPAGGLEVDLHVIDIDAYVGSISHLGSQSDAFTTGAVVVRFSGSTQGGYGASLSAANGGSFVLHQIATAATTTSEPGDSLYFFNVAPKSTEVVLTAPSGAPACHDAFASGSTSYPVDPTTFTEIVLACP